MVKIDKDIRMNFFVEVFLKTFPISNVLLYGQPVVIRCEITINRDDRDDRDDVDRDDDDDDDDDDRIDGDIYIYDDDGDDDDHDDYRKI
jgi:hypothetical protein